jgi:hypothetical protein
LNRNKIRKGPKFRKEFEKFGNPFSIEKQLAHRGENQSGHTLAEVNPIREGAESMENEKNKEGPPSSFQTPEQGL